MTVPAPPGLPDTFHRASPATAILIRAPRLGHASVEVCPRLRFVQIS